MLGRRLSWIPVFLFGASAVMASPDTEFENLAKRYIGDLGAFSPVTATAIGDHSADDKLDEVDTAARERNRQRYLDYRKALAAIERDALSPANQIDAALLENEIESSLWAIEALEEWAWNPLRYVNLAGSAIYDLAAREFAPLEDRLLSAASRLEQLPRFFAQSREVLDPARVPKVHAETAAEQNPGLLGVIDGMIAPQLDALTPASQSRLTAAIDIARDAIAEQEEWLENELVPRAGGDFRLGAALYDAKLAFALDSSLSRREIRRLAEAEYESVRNQMYDVAKQVYAGKHAFTAFPDVPDEAYKQAIIRAALEEAYSQLPPRDGIVDTARQYLAQASEFVVEKDIVAMPEDPVEIIVMPEFQRGVAVAYYDGPGPLDKGLRAYYAIAPLPEDWDEDQVASFLREYNLYSIHDLTIHEAMPGHYLQLSLSNRYPSTLRAILGSGTFVEGWAVYAERMMIDEGYLDHDPLMHLINLKWYLRAITNAIIDSAIHVDGMTRDEAMRLMIEGGFQEEREAAGKWIRAQLTSTQLSTYFVGFQEHIALREAVEQDWGDEFTLRRYHDQILSYGSPPVKYVRAMVLGEQIL